MIPLRLTVKNFLCYREDVPPLDFQGIHVACLCGPNGHGKSALLDAITWCLWGKARGRTQDDLISYGSDESRVEMDFRCRDNSYRVIRGHGRAGARRRQGTSILELQVLDGYDGAESISGNTLRETQARIEQLVGMDYDTFINSAFLLQGRADEFTNKTPTERKAVLSKILGLDMYDRLQARARERLAAARDDANRVQGAVEQMEQEAQGMGDPAEELSGLAAYLKDLEERLEARRAEVEEARSQVSSLERQQQEIADLESQMERVRQDIANLQQGVEASRKRVQEYRDLVEQQSAIQEGAARLSQARQRYEALEEARQTFQSLSEEKSRVAHAIDNQRVRLETEAERLQKSVADLESRAALAASIPAEVEKARAELETVTGQSSQGSQLREKAQSLAVAVGEAHNAAQRHLAEGQDLRKRVDLVQSRDPDEARCPLCGAALGEDGCHRLAENLEAEIQEKRELYKQTQSQLEQLEAEKSSLDQELPRKEEAQARAQREAQLKLDNLERQLQDAQKAGEELEQARLQLEQCRESLHSGGFAAAERQQLQDIETRLASLGYDEDARRESYQQTQSLLSFEEKGRQLEEALARLPQEEESLRLSREMLQGRQEELSRLEATLQATHAALADLPRWQEALRQAQEQVADLEGNREAAVSRRGNLEWQLRRLDELREEIATSKSRLVSLEEERGICQELVTAFGRQGVQAMLIETVVPQIEEEANLLLGRMTDNRMNVKLETQRERRSGQGDPIETLEINVSDELGPRSYEMYSGGETFRVNLSLRIALSRVLSRRMGAPLPTLFIDEGFGTQDAAGRERIMDVISAIEDEFDKIVVITHLDELKDMFPVRIEVQKDGSTGSTFWLS